jgi:hypothetical protein
MTTQARKPVEIDADLYNDLVSLIGEVAVAERREDFAAMETRLIAVLLDDWCEDDGDGYCGNHDDRIEYWVDNFGPEGVVLTQGPYPPAVDVCFPVCPGAQVHREDAKPGDRVTV